MGFLLHAIAIDTVIIIHTTLLNANLCPAEGYHYNGSCVLMDLAEQEQLYSRKLIPFLHTDGQELLLWDAIYPTKTRYWMPGMKRTRMNGTYCMHPWRNL